ncbi:hypothetical protein VEE76_28000 [Escherichia coli]|nr:hypothetical protein VEE76_28000 [Escherichia coli]
MSLLPDATLNASYQAYKAHCPRRPDKVHAASDGSALMSNATLNASYLAYKRHYLFWLSHSTNASNNWLSAA